MGERSVETLSIHQDRHSVRDLIIFASESLEITNQPLDSPSVDVLHGVKLKVF